MAFNAKFDATNHYFSGQGVVMIGSRDPVTGLPQGLRPVGNVTDLKITVATTVIDHKGSQDGQRAIDKRLQTETKATASVTIDNFIAPNLAKALRGQSTIIPAGSVTAEAIPAAGLGLVSGLKYINVNTVVVHKGVTTLTAYVDSVTAYDYKANLDAGSIQLNDGTVLATVNLGTTPTAITVGATTSITVTNTAVPGERVYMTGFAGADAGLLNGQYAYVVTATSSGITVNINTTGKTITVGTPTVMFLDETIALTVDYAYSVQYLVDSLTQPLTDNWLRFEGLNTVESNSPVIVDIFKFVNDPLKELALLSDTFGTFVLEGALLNDNLRPAGTSKYFSVKKLT